MPTQIRDAQIVSLAGTKLTGAIPAATLPAFTGGDVTSSQGGVNLQLAAGAIVNADINAAAALAWTKIDKTGAVLGDLGGAAALTRTNDTNVTLVLGGAPATALLAATSLTLGWAGTLAPARGGLGFDASPVAKGGVLAGTGAGTFGLTSVGADGQVLTADAASAGGVKWAAASGGLSGSGTTGTIPMFTSAGVLGNSILTQEAPAMDGASLLLSPFVVRVAAGATLITTTLSVGSGATVGTLGVTGAATLSGTLAVTGLSTLGPVQASAMIRAGGWYGGGAGLALEIGLTGGAGYLNTRNATDGTFGPTIIRSSNATLTVRNDAYIEMNAPLLMGGAIIYYPSAVYVGVPAGTAGAGIYSWYADTDTYIDNDSPNRIRIVCGGGAQFYVDTNQMFPARDALQDLGFSAIRWRTIYASAGVNTSDARLKEHIVDTAYRGDFLRALRPVDFQWKNKGTGAGVYQGFLASDVAAIAPTCGAVHYHDGVATGLNYCSLLAPVVAGWQEHDARIAALEQRLERMTPHGE